MDGFVWAVVLIVAALVLVALSVYFFVRKKSRRISELEAEVTKAGPVAAPQTAIPPTAGMLALVEKIEIANRSGQSLMLSSVDSSTALSTKTFREITARGTAIGARLVQGAMPALAQAQTFTQIAKAAPNGLFTATAPLTELMKYSDGTVGSIVMKGGKMVSHSGFQEVALSVANPAAVIGAGMQAMAEAVRIAVEHKNTGSGALPGNTAGGLNVQASQAQIPCIVKLDCAKTMELRECAFKLNGVEIIVSEDVSPAFLKKLLEAAGHAR